MIKKQFFYFLLFLCPVAGKIKKEKIKKDDEYEVKTFNRFR